MRLGLAYGQVTQYIDLPHDDYDVRVIAAGDRCSRPLGKLGDWRDVPALGAGVFATFVALGDMAQDSASERFRVVGFADGAKVGPDRAAVRVVHASVGELVLAGGIGGDDVDFPWIAFGAASEYALEAPSTNGVLFLREYKTKREVFRVSGVDLLGGAAQSIYLVGRVDSLGSPLRAVACPDATAATFAHGLTSCTVLGGALHPRTVR
jgi:hypothetical protein